MEGRKGRGRTGVDLKGSQGDKEIGRRGDREGGGKEGEGKDRRRFERKEGREEGGGRKRWKQGE